MEEIKEFLIKVLDDLKNNKSSYEEEINKNNSFYTKLDEIANDPDNLDEKLIKGYLSEEVLNSKEYLTMLALKGNYKKYPNVSQIINATNYLKEIINTVKEQINKVNDNNKDSLNSIVASVSLYQNALEFLNGYNSETYVEQKQFEELYNLFKEINTNNEIVNLFLTILKNNAQIIRSKTKKETELIDVEDIQRGESEISPSLYDEMQVRKNGLIKKVEDFSYLINEYHNNNQDFIYYDDIESILDNVKETLENCNDDELGTILIVLDDNFDFFEALKANEVKMVCALSIINAFLYNEAGKIVSYNEDKIKSIISSYNAYYKEDIVSFKNSSGYDKLKSYIDNRYPNLASFLISLSQLEEKDRESIFNTQYQDNNYKYMYPLLIEFERIKDVVERSRFVTIKDGEILRKKIESLKLKIDISNQSLDTPNNETKIPYSSDFVNYVLCLNPKMFIREFEELKSLHSDIKYADLLTKIQNAGNNSIDSLKNKYSKTLKDGNKDGNEFNIREMDKGKIRVDYKILEGVKIDGHNIIVLLRTRYGNYDASTKNDDISLTINNFDVNEYGRLVNMFSNALSFDDLSDEAKAFIYENYNLFNDIQNKDEENMSVGGR